MDKTELFFSNFKKQVFEKGKVLIRADEEPEGIFYIQEGIVRQYYISKKGDEITLNMFKTESFFPMSMVLCAVRNNYYYEAMTNCVVYKAPKKNVLDFLLKEPDVMLDLLRRVYIGIEGLWLHIEYLTAGNSFSKLTSSLIILARRFGKKEKEGIVIQLKMTEKELGEYSGMYRETVSREIQTLRKKGLLLYSNGIVTIPNISELENALTL